MKENKGPGFTKRELEILILIVKGHSSKLIASELSIAEGTVELHRNNLIKKAKAVNMVDVAVKAIRAGWVD